MNRPGGWISFGSVAATIGGGGSSGLVEMWQVLSLSAEEARSLTEELNAVLLPHQARGGRDGASTSLMPPWRSAGREARPSTACPPEAAATHVDPLYNGPEG